MQELTSNFKQDLSKGISARIKQANGRLKSGLIGVSIQQIGSKLYLQATLPPKPGSSKPCAYQQRIALGFPANPAGLSLAEREARKVGGLLACRQFDWEPYLEPKSKEGITVAEAIAKLESEIRPTVKPVTWRTDYAMPLRKLPQEKPLSLELLTKVIESTADDSRLRKRCALAFSRLAKSIGLDADFKAIQGNYSALKVGARDLPSDEAIAKVFTQISEHEHPGWSWVYGMLATFGLRGHEVFYLDTSALQEGGNSIQVLEGKTGFREVWSYYPEWIELFNLREPILPAVTGKEHQDFTNRVCKFFGRLKPGFTALDLRHAWAVRTLLYGLPYEMAARQMGHSVEVHEKTYHRWIKADHHQKMFEALAGRTDRPKAPLNLLRH